MSRYAELLARLMSARRFGIVLGTGQIRELLDALGAPDTRLGIVIHVGGTNGKGSTVASLAALAAAGGRRVATYTSPHLSSLRERIVIDGAMIGEDALVEAADRVRAAGGDERTFFEQLTAIACVAIAAAGVDVTVLEVGLGGRLDATNAIAAPIAVVTGVAMDHEAILGDTLEAIASEKAGIFKPGQRVVIGGSGEPAGVRMLEARAQRAGAAAITVLDAEAIARVPPLAMAGAHQRANAAAALAAIDHLEALEALEVARTAREAIAIDAITRARALAAVRHPGRFEIIEGPPRIILDGAHNPHGAAALAETLRGRGERPVVVLALSADKDARAIVTALAPAVAAVIATRFQQDRALEPAALAAIVQEITSVPVEIAGDLAAADALARAHGRTILIAGSLFLVGEARVRYLGAPADPIAVSDPSPARP